MHTISVTQQVTTGIAEAMQHATRMHPLRSGRRELARQSLAGFTLIELMIVVAITAILAAIAIPAYQKQIMQSRRTSAKTALLDVASREEKYFATSNYYPATLSSVGYANVTAGVMQVPNNTNEDYYSVGIVVTAAAGTTPASFIATAIPAGTQKNDSCGTYTITDLGVQSASGTTSGNGSGCW
jgi:type IV pilus assembly protein PilE